MNMPDDGSSRSLGESNESSPYGAYTPAGTSTIPLPDTPPPQPQRSMATNRTVDKEFVAVMAALGGAESLRLATHKLMLDHEFDAGAPWVPGVPANRHFVAKYSEIYAAELLVAYELKKPHSWLPGDRVIRKLWWTLPATLIPIHIKNGIRSIRTQPPSCPVADCQAS